MLLISKQLQIFSKQKKFPRCTLNGKKTTTKGSGKKQTAHKWEPHVNYFAVALYLIFFSYCLQQREVLFSTVIVCLSTFFHITLHRAYDDTDRVGYNALTYMT